MKILVIGDIHVKPWIISRVQNLINNPHNYDRIVYMGDYVNDWNATVEDNISTLNQLIKFKLDNNEKTILLLGNHDLFARFITDHQHPMFNASLHHYAKKFFNEYQNLFQLAYCMDDYLFTHAGLATTWAKEHDVPTTDLNKITETLNSMDLISLISKKSMQHWNNPIFIRPQRLTADPIYGIKQIVGHTPVNTITKKSPTSDSEFIFCDTFSTYSDGTPIGDRSFLEIDTVTNEFGAILE